MNLKYLLFIHTVIKVIQSTKNKNDVKFGTCVTKRLIMFYEINFVRNRFSLQNSSKCAINSSIGFA